MLGVSMYSLSQIVSSKGRRRWILMDVTICLPALYPLRYVVDHLEYRSPSTQSASLQAIKFFYDFWFIKHRTTFCYSFYFSGHDPAIAIHEMTDFFQYLENGRLVSFAPRALPFKHSSCMTNASRVRAVIRFIGYLIATYVSPYYRNETPKELSRYASRLNTRLLICKDEFKTLERSNQRYYSRVTQGFQSMTGDMVENVYRIVVPSSKHKNNFLNPFPSGFIQFRNYLIMRLMLNYGLRVGELLLLECVSVKIPGIIFLKSCSDFDDKHIHNEGDEWLFYYSGSKRYVYFKLDELTNTLLKYFCFKYVPIIQEQTDPTHIIWTQA